MQNFPKSAHVSADAKIGKGTVLGENVIVMAGAVLGENVSIGNNVVIRQGVIIGDNVRVEDGAVLGRVPSSGAASRRQITAVVEPLKIGNSCSIGTNAVIYTGTVLDDRVMVGDLASIRERVRIGKETIVGRLVMVECETVIGSRTRIQTGSHITGDAIIEDDVFFGDEVSTTNDNSMGRGSGTRKGPHIKTRARIGSNATLLPGIEVGESAVVAAGSVVTKDVPSHKLVMGVPARIIRDVE